MSTVFLFTQWREQLDGATAARWDEASLGVARWFGVEASALGPTMVDIEGPRLILVRSLPNGEFLAFELGRDSWRPAGSC